MADLVRLRCPGCGVDRKPSSLGLAADGHFDIDAAFPNELSLRVDRFRGRGRIVVTRDAAPLPLALGVRTMLRHRLAQLEADIRAAGVELPDDD